MRNITCLTLTLSVFAISSCSEPMEPELNEISEDLNAAQIVLDKYYAATQTSRNASSPQITRVSYKTYKIKTDTITEISEVATLSRSVNDSVFTLATAEFEIDGTNGFAILSEDSNLNKVFYYTECGNPSDTTYNKGLAFIMNDIPAVAASYLAETANTTSNTSSQTYNIGPLVRFKWGQGYPFNYYTTECNCSTCSLPYYRWRNPIGCVPIAVAQAIATVGRFRSTYYGSRSYNFSQLPEYAPHDLPAQNANVTILAHFLHEVAVNCQTKFACAGSGASPMAAYRYLNDLGYLCSYVNGGYIVIDKLIENLQAGSPTLVSGFVSTTGSGHMWIVDGFRNTSGTNEYHCNWGWDGSSNGWAADYWTANSNSSYPINRSYIYLR